MPFYIGQYGNPEDGFDVLRKLFDSDQEKEEFITQHSGGVDSIYGLRIAKNLAELLYEWGYGYQDSSQTIEERTTEIYRELVSKFSKEKIEREFPGEIVDNNLFLQIEELYERDFADDEPDVEPSNYSRLERGQDMNQDSPEDADSGFWRIARDNG